jgi:hypothetical protein
MKKIPSSPHRLPAGRDGKREGVRGEVRGEESNG